MAAGRLHVDDYDTWFATLPAALRHAVESSRGTDQQGVCVHDDHLTFAGIDLAGPWWPSSHHAVRRGSDRRSSQPRTCLHPTTTSRSTGGWMRVGPMPSCTSASTARSSGCLGKGAGLSAACAPDAAIEDLPLLYLFVVNDPGEGTQAKRRGARPGRRSPAGPPMTQAETYDDLARVERLLDEYAKIEARSDRQAPRHPRQPGPARHLRAGPRPRCRDDMLDPDDFAGHDAHIDGYLCALKDAQPRAASTCSGGCRPSRDSSTRSSPSKPPTPGTVPSLRATVAAELIDPVPA